MILLSEYHTVTSVSPAIVFARWADPATWPLWDPEVREVHITSPVDVGARGTLRPVAGPPLRFRVTRIVPDCEFTNVGVLPGARLEFVHRVEVGECGSTVSVTVRVHGILAWLWGRVLGRSMAGAARSSVDGLLGYLERVA